MAKKSQESFDLLLYSVGLALAFMVFLLSRWLSEPLMDELETGTSLVHLVFNSNDQISLLWNLILPTFLLLLGVTILLTLLWQMAKAIMSKHDSKLNKLLLILIAHIIVIDLIITFKNSWQLLVFNLKYLAIFVIVVCLVGFSVKYFKRTKLKS